MTQGNNNKGQILKTIGKFFNEGKFGTIKSEDITDEKLLNRRIVCEDYFGTIKYIGQIPKSNGVWLGVDWDDESRGRHNGSHDGVKYFVARTDKSGSFVRPVKVSRGLTLEESVEIRYGTSSNDISQLMLDEFVLESSDSDDECGSSGTVLRPNACRRQHQKVKVHISGPSSGVFNVHSGNMHRIKALVLHSLPIFRGMSDEECKTCNQKPLAELIPNNTELDLAQTLICDWVELAEICAKMPCLTNLNISDNKFLNMFPKDSNSSKLQREQLHQLYHSSFNRISYLITVRLYLLWDSFIELFQYFPKLHHLCLAYNNLSILEPAVHSSFVNMTYLDLACNNINDFEKYLQPFGQLSQLDTFLLNENQIQKITLPGSVIEETDLFPKLRLLAISNNVIDNWESIHHVARITSLKELIFMFNPILETQKNAETARQDVIAKMPKLKMLNRNDIKYDERKGAEIDYMKRYGRIWLEAQPAKDDEANPTVVADKLRVLREFHENHPRFMKLVDLYGAPEHSEVKEVTRKLKEGLIQVQFDYEDVNSGQMCSLKKRIPNHMTVQHLRALLRRLCKLPAKSEFNLAYVSSARPNLEIPLDADTREIGFYNVQEGDRVLIHEIY